MGPMGEARQAASSRDDGSRRKLSWGGTRYGCLDPEEPRIMSRGIGGASSCGCYLLGLAMLFGCRMCRWFLSLAGSNCDPAVRVVFNFSQEEGPGLPA